ncbi:hypothetical protein [Granulicella sp. WH15]|uniref:hypothetical protein n=1 Tax=Granulicella sp. WH15 TaxID=2602070 RepID=UPI0013A56973|nr:hypothetical protein [Granulicella sp. WH15]
MRAALDASHGLKLQISPPRCKVKGKMIQSFSPSFTIRFWRAYWRVGADSAV